MDKPDEQQADRSLQLGAQHVSAHRVSEEEFCRYCGGRLVAGYYFCPVCATPYKSHELMTAHIKPVPLTESELIRKRAPQAIKLFWTYAAVIVAAIVFCEMVFQEENFFLKQIVGTTALFVTTCIFTAMHWESLAVQFKRIGFGHPAAWLGLAAIVPLLAVNHVYHSWVVESLGGEVVRPQEMGKAAVFFFFCICPGVLEEIAFRGLVQHWLTAAIRPMRALLLASALFMALHGSIISAPYLFAVGMVLGWTKWKTGSLYPPMLIHLLHNWIALEYL